MITEQEHSHSHHISSVKLLLSVGAALFFLTALTVLVSDLHLPSPYNVIAALVIAFGKAGLVAAFFMELYWDKRFNAMLFVMSILFLALLIGLTVVDVLFRPEIIPSF